MLYEVITISVATSVLAFIYKDKKINILDTPGHKDFAEDTFRTLTAVDSVIVVIDVAKGVEEQTEKLVEVCRMRNIVITSYSIHYTKLYEDVTLLFLSWGRRHAPSPFLQNGTEEICADKAPNSYNFV